MAPRVLFVCQTLTSFVKEDIELLRERYDVRVFVFDANQFSSRFGHLFGLLYYSFKQFFWLLRELPRAGLIYGWFADYHLVLPAVLGRMRGIPFWVALGGFDANTLPAVNYGAYESAWRGPLVRFVLRTATRLLPVSEAMMEWSTAYSAFPGTLRNGVRMHVPDCRTPHTSLPFGYAPDEWPEGPAIRDDVVATVAFIGDMRTAYVKGIDVLVEVARHMPDVTFKVVGVKPEFARALAAHYDAPYNVELQPPRLRQDLVAVYQEASVYAQLSRTEGFPNVLCEAMCCGCIPVGSSVAGIPEAIGEAGYLVETPEAADVAAVLKKALTEANAARRAAARRRIMDHFNKEQRRHRLQTLIDEEIKR